jgi:hypothetical protein
MSNTWENVMQRICTKICKISKICEQKCDMQNMCSLDSDVLLPSDQHDVTNDLDFQVPFFGTRLTRA